MMRKPTTKQKSELRDTVFFIMMLWGGGLIAVAVTMGAVGVFIYIISGVLSFAIGVFCLAYSWAKGDLE